jgi:hypothetical protein
MTKPVELTADIDIEQTWESFHAHAIPHGADIRPGDVVMVHDAPTDIGFGQRSTGQRRATLWRANALVRAWTRATGIFAVSELYEVGFSPAAPEGH